MQACACALRHRNTTHTHPHSYIFCTHTHTHAHMSASNMQESHEGMLACKRLMGAACLHACTYTHKRTMRNHSSACAHYTCMAQNNRDPCLHACTRTRTRAHTHTCMAQTTGTHACMHAQACKTQNN